VRSFNFGLVVATVLLVAAPARAQWWQKNEYQLQKDAAERYVPAPLRADWKAQGAVRVLRLRFWADADYRAGGANWQDRVRAQLEHLNAVLEPAFAVRLSAESFHRWDRASGGGALAAMLDELARKDPGDDVDWVVGFVSPLPLVAMSFHDLGMAKVLGRHFVLRGMSSYAEMQQLQEVFRALDQGQRDKLYGARKAHKELSVFLHEWAHTLGAMHVEQPTRIMSPGYTHRTTNFDEHDSALIATALRVRAAGTADWSALGELVRSRPAPDWRPSERAELLALVDAARARPTPPAPPLQGLPGAPAAGTAQPPATPAPDERPAPSADLPPAIAALLTRGAVSEAVRAATAIPAGSRERLAADSAIARERQTLGLPAAGKRFQLPPADEPSYALVVRGARQALAAGPTSEAEAAITAGLARYPQAPGLLLLACDLGARQAQAKAARRCADAVAVMPELVAAHRLLGNIALASGQPEPALKSLKRALQLGGPDAALWQALGEAHRALGRQQEFHKLLADYEDRAAATGR
jgi:hypothetical protein